MKQKVGDRFFIWRRVGIAFVFLFFLVGGIAHFAFARGEIGIIPPFVPYPTQVNYVVGVFEILGAIGLLIPAFRRAAAMGLMLLAVCVTPANVLMLEHADRFPDIPTWALVARLPLQILLIALIGWSGEVWMRHRD